MDTILENEKTELTMPRETFTIHDEGSANWYLRKLAEIEGEQARIKAQTSARVAELQSDAERLKFLFGEPLAAWARGEAKRRHRKSVTLMQGTVSFRSVPKRWKPVDAEEAFVHARTAFPDFIQSTPKLDMTAYLAYADATGEALPGLEAVPERESMSIKFGGKTGEGEPNNE